MAAPKRPNILAVILGGGAGTRLSPLTLTRSKPAVPLGGKYRLIDVPLSNCLNSGLNQIYVLTQFQSESLHRHVKSTYLFDHFSNGFVEILAAQQRRQDPDVLLGVPAGVGVVGIAYGLEQCRCRRREPHARPTTGEPRPRDSDARTGHLRRRPPRAGRP